MHKIQIGFLNVNSVGNIEWQTRRGTWTARSELVIKYRLKRHRSSALYEMRWIQCSSHLANYSKIGLTDRCLTFDRGSVVVSYQVQPPQLGLGMVTDPELMKKGLVPGRKGIFSVLDSSW